MLESHYAPRCRVLLVDEPRRRVRLAADMPRTRGPRRPGSRALRPHAVQPAARCRRPRHRHRDRRPATAVGLGHAIRDRLTKAASPPGDEARSRSCVRSDSTIAVRLVGSNPILPPPGSWTWSPIPSGPPRPRSIGRLSRQVSGFGPTSSHMKYSFRRAVWPGGSSRPEGNPKISHPSPASTWSKPSTSLKKARSASASRLRGPRSRPGRPVRPGWPGRGRCTGRAGSRSQGSPSRRR